MSISLFSLMSVILPLCQYKYNLRVSIGKARGCITRNPIALHLSLHRSGFVASVLKHPFSLVS